MTTAEAAPTHESSAHSPARRRFRPFANPVVLKELRGRMRGARAFMVLTVYLLLMSGFTTLLYVLTSSTRDIYGFTSGGQIGRVLFVGIVGIELFLVSFIAPAFTAGAISGERERQTYDLLRTTLLPPRSLVVGKMISALSYILLLLLAAIPLQSIAFLFGGVTETEVVIAFVILVATGVMLGTIGLYFSAVMQRTLSANVVTYGVALGITLGIPLILLIVRWLAEPLLRPQTFQTLSPTVQAIITYAFGFLIATNPLATAYVSQQLLLTNQQAGFFLQTQTTTSGVYNLPIISPWIIFTILYFIVSVIMIVLTVRRVRRIEV
jgi:ABC-type transport system involved in multi-copper enzyme maturation permease subunit